MHLAFVKCMSIAHRQFSRWIIKIDFYLNRVYMILWESIICPKYLSIQHGLDQIFFRLKRLIDFKNYSINKISKCFCRSVSLYWPQLYPSVPFFYNFTLFLHLIISYFASQHSFFIPFSPIALAPLFCCSLWKERGTSDSRKSLSR